jgi:hypothetical protein
MPTYERIFEKCAKVELQRREFLKKILSTAMEDLQHELEVCEDLVQQH